MLGRRQNSVGSAAVVLMVMVFLSRVLGLIRDRMLAARFAPEELGIYFAAFRLPNLMFELLVMGALTSAFIPVFTKYITQQKKDEAWQMAASLINASLIVFGVIALPIIIWARELSQLLAPGFSKAQIDQMAIFTQFMIVFQVTPLLIGNFFTGILQSFNLFILPALAPVIYNVGIIAGIIFLTKPLGLFAPVVGVGIGAVLFLLIQIPAIIAVGYRHRLRINIKQKGVREVGTLMAPRTFGLAIAQIDTTVDLMLSSLLGARMVTIFNFAQHLQQLPVGLFGATIAQAALPALSVSSVKEDSQEFKKTILSSMHQVLFFVLPASMLFMVLRIPVVRLVFGADRFDWEATVLTGMTLSMFSLSLFAQSVSQILARAFYALYDSKTPVIIGVISIAINCTLSVTFISHMHLPVWSLGLSTSIASFFNMILLLVVLDRRLGYFSRLELLVPPLKMIVVCVVTGIALYIPLKLLDQLVFDTTRTFGLFLLTGFTSAVGLSTYMFLSWLLGVSEVQSFLKLLGKFRRPRTILLEPASEVVNNGGVET